MLHGADKMTILDLIFLGIFILFGRNAALAYRCGDRQGAWSWGFLPLPILPLL